MRILRQILEEVTLVIHALVSGSNRSQLVPCCLGHCHQCFFPHVVPDLQHSVKHLAWSGNTPEEYTPTDNTRIQAVPAVTAADTGRPAYLIDVPALEDLPLLRFVRALSSTVT